MHPFFSINTRTCITKLVARNMFASGDWRLRDCIAVRLPGCLADYSEEFFKRTRSLVTEGLAFAFIAEAPRNFASHHFTGHTETTCTFGILESCNGLLSMTYPFWALSQGSKRKRQAACLQKHFSQVTILSKLAQSNVITPEASR